MIFRIKFERTGAHVRCLVYVAPGENRTFAPCGEFTVREGKEFTALKRAFSAEFIDGESDMGTVKLARSPEICEAMRLCLTQKKAT